MSTPFKRLDEVLRWVGKTYPEALVPTVIITTLNLNAAPMPVDEARRMRIDRTEEVRDIVDALGTREHNVLVYGTRGVGKSFLVKLVAAELEQARGPVYACIASVASVSLYGLSSRPDDTSGFLRAILLQFCKSLWELCGLRYLDLRQRLIDPLDTSDGDTHDASCIVRVYKQLMRIEESAQHSSTQSVGVGAGIKGELKEETSTGVRSFNILPFEFAEFVDELTVYVLHPRGYKRVVFLCDEANLMPIFRQEQLLEQYLDLFRSKGGQFLFVAGFLPGDEGPVLPSCFETVVELKGFRNREDICDLLSLVIGNEREFSPEAIDALFEAYSGHPRLTLEVVRRAIQAPSEKQITAASVVRASRAVDAMLASERRAHVYRNDRATT